MDHFTFCVSINDIVERNKMLIILSPIPFPFLQLEI